MAVTKRKGANAQRRAAQKRKALAKFKLGRWITLGVILFLAVSFLIRWYPTSHFAQKVQPMVQISGVELRGVNHLDSSLILATLGLDSTTTLFDISIDSLQELVASIEGVQWAKVKRTFTKKLRVTIKEREIVTLCIIDGTLYFSDSEGVLWPFIPGRYYAHPVVIGIRDTIDSSGVHKIQERDFVRLSKVQQAFTMGSGQDKRVVSYDLSSLDRVAIRWEGVLPEVRISIADLEYATENIETLLSLLEAQEIEAMSYIDFSYKNIAFIK